MSTFSWETSEQLGGWGCEPLNTRAVSKPARVLIAHRDESLMAACRESLAHNGFTVATARNDLECIAGLRQLRPIVLVLDIDLPRSGGQNILAIVMHDSGIPVVPVTVLTVGWFPKMMASVLEMPSQGSRFNPLPHSELSAILGVLQDPYCERNKSVQTLSSSAMAAS